jgi:RimJ/RimL family protein N-acetyltransferase
MYAGEKVTLAPFTEEYSEIYRAWVNQSETARMVTRCLPVTAIEHRRWYESCMNRSDAVFFSVVANDTDRYMGNVWLWGIHPQHRTAELRILIGDSTAQGKGYGTEACRLLLDFSFRQLNLNKVYVYVLGSNGPARRTFEKAGFRPEGTLPQEFFLDGAYQDALRMSVLRQDWLQGMPKS